MKKTFFSRSLSFIACIVLTAAIALFTTGCNDSKTKPADAQDSSGAAEVSQTDVSSEENAGVTVLGEGQTVFTFKMIDAEGQETLFEIHTDEKTVGAALLKVELVAGDITEYGLYVKTVNGVTLDYKTDGKYWAFYVNGTYASTGVDSTDIEEGAEYMFKAE